MKQLVLLPLRFAFSCVFLCFCLVAWQELIALAFLDREQLPSIKKVLAVLRRGG
jgi:hypothetical protein